MIALFIWGLRLFGFAEEADALLTAHEAKKKAREAQDAQASINRESDAAVDDQLRGKYTRD